MIRAFPLLLLLFGLTPTLPAQSARFAARHRMIEGFASAVNLIEFLDCDGDGDLDLLLGGWTGQASRLFINLGDAVLVEAPGALPSTVQDAKSAAACADFNGDGNPDLVVSGSGGTFVWLGAGGGSFVNSSSWLPPGTPFPAWVDAGDVDGDGDADLVLSSSAGLVFHLNSGSSLVPTGPPLAGVVGPILLIDAQDDGDLDLVISQHPYGTDLMLNDGIGNFGAPIYVSGWSGAKLGGDLDGDGDSDLVIVNSTLVTTCENTAAGFFPWSSLAFGAHPDRAGLGDVNSDGALDLLAAEWTSSSPAGVPGPLRLALNDGTGTFTDASSQMPHYGAVFWRFGVADLDGDGDADAVGCGRLKESPELILGDGSGGFTLTGWPFIPGPGSAPAVGATELAVGDLDADGDLDVLMSRGSAPPGLFLNDGHGWFADAGSQLASQGPDAQAVAIGDVDGDGDPDLIIGHRGAGQNELHLNGGSGIFVPAALPPRADDTDAIALGDLDGDGDLDALIGNSGIFLPRQNGLLLNSGGGSFFDASSQLPALADRTRDIALGDLDGDGWLDAVVANREEANHILWHGPAGWTLGSLGTAVYTEYSSSVALGDVDGDGDLDVVIGNGDFEVLVGGMVGSVQQQNRLYRNDGGGQFTELTTTHMPFVLDATLDVLLADVDEDGDPDLVVGNERESDYVLENDGSGSFLVVIPTLSANHQTRSLGGGDLDGDGDWDVVIGSRWMYTAEILFNGLRQASWLGLPRFGKPLKIVLDGPPGETWYLFASGATGQLPLPPFGTVGLDLGGIVFLGNGLLDNFGRGAWSAAMPPNPGGLAGLTGYVQAVVGFHQPRLTNVEPLVLTDF